MGCDIHAGIEVNDGDGWKPVMFPNPYHGKWDGEDEMTPDLHLERNYSAFSILADVRNGRGFAGCDTGDGFVPIAERRGLPDDAHPLTLDKACDGDHSPTWLSAEEILAYDWTRKTKRRGWVAAVAFEEWDRMKKYEPRPPDWCGGVMGAGVQHVSQEEMRRRVKDVKEQFPGDWNKAQEAIKAQLAHTYCQIEWEEPYTRAAGQLWLETVPLLMKLRAQHKQVRIVMNFDS